MWDERYSTKEYAYGTTPNLFLKENLASIPKGKVLCLAEGEGRNAVFLARQGYKVTAVDSSSVGLEKARKLAENHGVTIELVHADLAKYEIPKDYWDGIVSIFCPVPSLLRKELHKKVMVGLKKNGVFLLEAYTPKQVDNDTGGGKSIDIMMSQKSLELELKELNFSHIQELERNIIEGMYHTGISSVVQLIGIKST